jgi:hypothetical protein
MRMKLMWGRRSSCVRLAVTIRKGGYWSIWKGTGALSDDGHGLACVE